jgi:hypothetical protein
MNRSAEIGKKLTEKFDIFLLFLLVLVLVSDTHTHPLIYLSYTLTSTLIFTHTHTHTNTHTYLCICEERRKETGGRWNRGKKMIQWLKLDGKGSCSNKTDVGLGKLGRRSLRSYQSQVS